ncbi:unnamed protein product [Oikopleura dioica]|uniref:Uncharacterized protein n=1 Tax=Oikopleura dioica TaxID=34765 RepID=E4XUZ6_OIKDI|nr:unnamed protein product [Oikopleura dioica]
MIKKDEPEVDTSKIIDEDGDPKLVNAMKNELAVLREKNRILEQKYKTNRRISPRVQIKAGKTIEPPDMAPESTYTSSYSQNPTPSSNAQLSVLRHE